MKANPPLRCPWHRGSMIGDTMLGQSDLDLIGSMLEGTPSRNPERHPPGPPLEARRERAIPHKVCTKSKAFPYGLDYQETTSYQEMRSIAHMLILYDLRCRAGKWFSYYVAPLWPIIAFLLFLYLVWRFA